MLFAQFKPYGYTSINPPIKFKFFKYMALTKTDLQKIGDLMDRKFKERFAEHDVKWDKKLDKKFKERFAEQDRKWDKKLDKRFKQNNSELIIKLYDIFATKQDLEDCKNELRDEFREKIAGVQESILKFHNEWRLGQPPMVREKLENHEKRIKYLEEKTTEYDKG
jgi:hypothetical protein